MNFIDNMFTDVPSEERFSAIVHLIGFLLYLTVVVLSIVFLIKLRRKSLTDTTYHIGGKGVQAVFIGFIIFSLNSLLTSFSLLISNGEKAFLYHTKGFLAPIGNFFLLLGINFFILGITKINPLIRQIFRYTISFTLAMMIVVTLTMIGFFFNPPEETFRLNFFVIAGSGTMIISLAIIILLSFEVKHSKASFVKLKLSLLLSAFLFTIIGLVFMRIFLAVLIIRESIFAIYFSNILYPVLFSFFNITAIILFYWSIFTPEWLLRTSKIHSDNFFEGKPKADPMALLIILPDGTPLISYSFQHNKQITTDELIFSGFLRAMNDLSNELFFGKNTGLDSIAFYDIFVMISFQNNILFALLVEERDETYREALKLFANSVINDELVEDSPRVNPDIKEQIVDTIKDFFSTEK
ncbi:MAG: hypothetical protein ACTSYA_04895 [Candidatus Kariarchaeaceae archaeon]